MSKLSIPMEVGEWVLVGYEWGTSSTVTARYERDVGTCGKAHCSISVLPHQLPSAIKLLQEAQDE